MKSRLFKFLTFVVAAALLFASFGAFNAQAVAPASSVEGLPPPPETPQLPPEVLDEIGEINTVDEFLARHRGPIPRALAAFADTPVTVILEMEAPPLAALVSDQLRAASEMAASEQQSYAASLTAAQEPVVAGLESLGGVVLGRYTKAYNGILVELAASQLVDAASLPGVVAIHRAPTHQPVLSKSIELINADDVWTQLGFEGDGITIAIVDTGIDYTHAAFGGPGTEQAYDSNDPNIIEPGTFPTAKVIGGYDFAGTDYNASDPDFNVPLPDPDPLDENGHGTHVASIAAGMEITSTHVGRGVAPEASLYALKVFGAAGSTNLVLNAIDWALDPDQNGILNDRVDVINMSLGSDFGPNDPFDPQMIAVNYASALGTIVVAASGNAGDTPFITSSPASANAAISVAATTTGWLTGPTVGITGTEVMTLTGIVYRPPGFDNGTGHFTEEVIAPLAYVGTLTTTDTLCDITGIPTDALEGTVALIQRGVCAFTTKVNNAAALGAEAAIIFNSDVGGDELTSMGGPPVDIPAGFIGHSYGLYLITADGETVVVSEEHDVITIEDPVFEPDELAAFSGRGPRGLDGYVKPEISAPGVGIFAAEAGTGVYGTPLNGTSMATPHVAGVAALMREAHPNWTVEQIKAAMMNTAVDVVEGTVVPLMGAGRIDALEATTTDSIAVGDTQLVSVNWGILMLNEDMFTDSGKFITVHNMSGADKTYDVDVFLGTGSFTESVTIEVSPTVDVPANGQAAVMVELTIDVTGLENELAVLEEYYGFVTFTNQSDADDMLRVPFSFIVRPYSELDVVITDTDEVSGTVSVTMSLSGPSATDLGVVPLFDMDPNELSQGDEADLRMVGLDYMTMGADEYITPVFNTWGYWHTPQLYFAEFDVYYDVDEDGVDDFVQFNYNFGGLQGLDDTDDWIIVQVDLNTGALAFSGAIITDYISGLMMWYIPTDWLGVSAAGPNTDFRFQVFAYDYNGNEDAGDINYFDTARPPLSFTGPTADLDPMNPTGTLEIMVNDWSGYVSSQVLGAMVFDFNGMPGEGQAYAVLFNFLQETFLPIVRVTPPEMPEAMGLTREVGNVRSPSWLGHAALYLKSALLEGKPPANAPRRSDRLRPASCGRV